MKYLVAISRKEFLHILRDPRSLIIILVIPIFMVVIYGHAISLDLKEVEMAVVDLSNSTESRAVMKAFHHHPVFHVRDLSPENSIEAAESLMTSGNIDEFIVIPPDFSGRLHRREPADVAVIIDGSDSNTATLIRHLNDEVLTGVMKGFLKMDPLEEMGIQFFYNPEMKGYFFIIPGMVAVLMLLLSASLTSISISREKENGSIFLMFISPVRTREIIGGKILPYIVVALIEGFLMIMTAHLWFRIPIRGSFVTLLGFSFLYVITGLSFGILVSVWASSQRSAMLSTLLIILLPSIMMTGFIFPIHSLSPVLRGISAVIPTTYFLKIIRGILLKGAVFSDFLLEGSVLLLMGVVFLWAAGIKFLRLRRYSR